MQASNPTDTLPRTLEEFLDWEPNDGFKYEWNDGEMISFTGMKENQIYIYDRLLDLFIDLGYKSSGTLIAEQDVHLTGIQVRRPDIAYFTREQIRQSAREAGVVPEFVIEIISNNDEINKLEQKLTEYFKAGVRVVWIVIPEHRIVQVYTSRRTVKICLENDRCSAAPVLPDFEVSVSELFALPE